MLGMSMGITRSDDTDKGLAHRTLAERSMRKTGQSFPVGRDDKSIVMGTRGAVEIVSVEGQEAFEAGVAGKSTGPLWPIA